MMLKGMVKSRKVRSKILVENVMITSTIERWKQVKVFNEILPVGLSSALLSTRKIGSGSKGDC